MHRSLMAVDGLNPKAWGQIHLTDQWELRTALSEAETAFHAL